MAEIKAFEQIDAGGVDSRSNPLNLPRNRALRCQNWVPKQAGFWELRWGYSTVTMSTVTASTIHSMFPYRTWDGHKYVLFMSNDKSLKILDTATGTVTTPAIRGAAVASSAKGAGYFAANHFHYGNGTDQKWFDATTWRDNGLRAITSAEIQSTAVIEGVRELKPAEASTITLTTAGGGSFPGDAATGHYIFVAIMDVSSAQLFQNEIGPATLIVGPGRVVIPNSDKLTVGNMPDLSSVNSNWIKLIGGTTDGGGLGFFFTNTSSAISNISWSSAQLTVTSTSHGLSNGNPVILTGTGKYDGIYSVQNVIDANNFVVFQTISSNQGSVATGTAKRIVFAANATTGVDVLAPTQDMTYVVNQERGTPASTVGGVNPGYQFVVSLYNPTGGGHVGNFINIGTRLAQTAYRTNVHILFLPNNADVTDAEQVFLIGRTIDGGQVPYVLADANLNWATIAPAVTTTNAHLNQGTLDGQHAMPTRNGIIPSQCNMFCVAGDFVYAADPNSPYLRRSGDMSQNTDRGNTFTGRAEQSWAPDDVDTFPTGEATTGIFEVDQEVLQGTIHDTALSVNLAGIQQWVGPWAIGMAGRRAGIKCGSHGFYWVTGDKQLATLQQGVPVVVSEEYEQAELAQIGDSFISTVECTYFRSGGPQNKDELRIEFQRQDGSQYTVVHDFKLREVYSAPGSIYGQGYSSTFSGPLGTVFTSAQVRDGNGKLQVFAGASTGQIYELYSGADDVGNSYTGDLILLVNGGPNRLNVPWIDFYGDQNINVTLGRNLSTSLASGAQWGFSPPNDEDDQSPESVMGAEQDFLYRVKLSPSEVQRLYIRLQLTSHSADGNLLLNSPPHVPLENYGRLYEFVPSVGDERGR